MACFFRGVTLTVTAALIWAASAPRSARAEPPRQGRFSLDLFQGPILAPIGIMGIAGAYAGYAEGIAGLVANAASPAVREPFSVNYLELDGTASISFPISLFENNDFDNSGSIDYDYSNFWYITLGGLVQYGPFGAGLNVEFQRYTLTDAGQRTTNVTIGKYHVLGATRLIGDQLMLGAGARLATLGIDAPEGTFTMVGAAPEIGFLIRPDWKSFRLGATLRLPVEGSPFSVFSSGNPETSLILPAHVVLPWEIEAGFAIQIGPRPINPEWIEPRAQEEVVRASFRRRHEERAEWRRIELAKIGDPLARAARERELVRLEAEQAIRDARKERLALEALKQERRARYWNWPREHLLFTGEVLITGPVDQGISIQGFLGQNQPGFDPAYTMPGSSGARVSLSPRIGVETEPIPDLVHTRFGTYYEPSRLDKPVGRQHFTFGADIKLFKTTWFGLVPEVIYKLQAYADMAPRYQSVSLGAGVWH